MFRTIERYEEAGLGLPYPIVLIDSAEEEIDEATGRVVGISVPDLEQLVEAVAIARALYPLQMSGEEVKFVRNVLGMTATAFAEAISIDKATFSRWENGKQVLGEWADKQVRHIVVIKLGDRVPHLSLDRKAVVGMRIQRSQPGQWPTIEMRRVEVPASDCTDGLEEAWDALPFPIAA